MVQMETRTYRISAQDYEDATQLGLIPATIAREAVLKELALARVTPTLSLDEVKDFNRQFTAAVKPVVMPSGKGGRTPVYVCACGFKETDLMQAKEHYKEAHFK